MKNKYQHNDDGTTHIFVESKSKKFPGKHTIIIDTEDWEKVKEHRWYISSSGHKYPYAETNIPHPEGGWYIHTDGKPRRKQTRLRMHHCIMGKPKKGMVVDHIEHNGLDNRKANLREVTRTQNAQNMTCRKDSTSQYKGVGWHKQRKKWRARITDKQEEIHLGLFICKHEAAVAYNKKATELWGEHALLNEVEKQ